MEDLEFEPEDFLIEEQQEQIIDDYAQTNKAARLCGMPYQKMPHQVLRDEDNDYYKKLVLDYLTTMVSYAFMITAKLQEEVEESIVYSKVRDSSKKAQLGILFTKEGWIKEIRLCFDIIKDNSTNSKLIKIFFE
jgi:hypothetical protein